MAKDNNKKRYTNREPDTRGIVMPAEQSVDFDNGLGFYIAEQLMMRNENR